MGEKIGFTLTKLLSSLFKGFGGRESANMYIGSPIDPDLLPVDLTHASRYGRCLSTAL